LAKVILRCMVKKRKKHCVYVKFGINLITTVLEVQADLQTAFGDTV